LNSIGLCILRDVISQPLCVAFNGSALLSPLTGVGQYAKSLAEHLAHSPDTELHLFYAAIWSQDIRTGPIREISALKDFIKKVVPQPYRVSRAIQQWRFNLGIKRIRPHLYHEPNFLPFRFNGPTVITAHDLSWVRHPETHPEDRVAVMNDQIIVPIALQRDLAWRRNTNNTNA